MASFQEIEAEVKRLAELSRLQHDSMSSLRRTVENLFNQIELIRAATCPPVEPEAPRELSLEQLATQLQLCLKQRGCGDNAYCYQSLSGGWSVTRFGSQVIGHGMSVEGAAEAFMREVEKTAVKAMMESSNLPINPKT